MADQIGRFLINSDIVSTVSRSITVPAVDNSAIQFISTTTGDGSHVLFIVVKDVAKSLFYQFSLSVGLNFTAGNWLEVIPLESNIGSNNGIAIDFKSDGLLGELRLRRKYGSDILTPVILVYNLGYDATTTLQDILEEGAEIVGSIVSTPQGPSIGGGSGIADHNSLLNKGTYPHDAIDAHINNYNPHIGHELVARKGEANGYAPLGSDTKIPNTYINIGDGPGQILTGDSTDVERVSRKNAANGYAGLGADSKLILSTIPIGTSSSSVMRGDGPDVEKFVNKNVANGYAGLDASRYIPRDLIKFGNNEDSVCRGNDPRLENNYVAYDNINVSDQFGEDWYSIAHIKPSYVPNSLKVYVNGARQVLGLQYEENPVSGRFRFLIDVEISDTDIIMVDFRSEV